MIALRHIFGFGVLLLALRILFLCAALDPCEERVREVLDATGVTWQAGPERPLFDREEQYAASGAEALRMDFGIPRAKLQYMPYGGGSRLVIEAMVPICALLGSNYLACKILPLLVSLFGGLFWWLIVRRWIGLRAAWFFGLLYAFAPSIFVRTTLIAKGDHAEAMMLAGAVLLLATLTAQRRRWIYGFCAGLVAGFGIHVTYSIVPVVFSVLGLALLLTRGQPRRLWLAGTVGLLIGLIPWAVRILGSDANPLEIYNRPVASLIEPAAMVQRFRQLLLTGFHAGYDLPDLRSLTALTWMGFVVVGWIGLLRRVREPFAALTLTGTLALILGFCCVAPDASPRYLVSGYPLLMISVAHSVRRVTWMRIMPVGMLILIGLTAQAETLRHSTYRSLRVPLRGTDWAMLGEIAGQKLTINELHVLPRAVRPHFALGYGTAIYATTPPEYWNAAIEQARPELRPFLWEGIGLRLVQSPALLKAAPVIESLAPQDAQAVLRGIARYCDGVFAVLCRTAHPVDLSVAQRDIAGRYAAELDLVRARAVGVLRVQNVAMHTGAALGLSDAQLERGLGWALYRGFTSHDLLLFSEFDLHGSGASEALWQGIADAFERDLETIDPAWLIGPHFTCRPLADLLEGIAPELPDGLTLRLYEAAAGACRKAWYDPLIVNRADLAGDRLHWRAAIPIEYHDAFRAGLDAMNAGPLGLCLSHWSGVDRALD